MNDYEIRTPLREKINSYAFHFFTGKASFLFMPHTMESGSIVYSVKNAKSLASLYEEDPDVFGEILGKISISFQLLDEFMIGRNEICWNPKCLFFIPSENSLRFLWMPEGACISPEREFLAWAETKLWEAVGDRAADEEAVLRAVWLCRAFDGKKSIEQSASEFSSYCHVRKEEKEDIEKARSKVKAEWLWNMCRRWERIAGKLKGLLFWHKKR